MKKIIAILFMLLLVATPALADVYLVWDNNPASENVDLYQVEIDGQIVADVVPNTYSVVALAGGSHVARVRAHNIWGWGDFSIAFNFDKVVPSVPTGIRIENIP